MIRLEREGLQNRVRQTSRVVLDGFYYRVSQRTSACLVQQRVRRSQSLPGTERAAMEPPGPAVWVMATSAAAPEITSSLCLASNESR